MIAGARALAAAVGDVRKGQCCGLLLEAGLVSRHAKAHNVFLEAR